MNETHLKGSITSEDVLGKDVVDATGVIIGVTDKLYLNPKNLGVIGVSVDKGFLRKGFVISTGYVKEVTDHAVLLSIQPSTLLKGRLVFDKHGAKVGKVIHVELHQETNKLTNLIVKKGFLGLNHIIVSEEHIKSKEENIFLNISKEELHKKKK